MVGMLQESAEVCLGNINTLVSGIVGSNHSLSAYVGKTGLLGVRTVEISVMHEASYGEENADRVKAELSTKVQDILNTLSDQGYSVTESDNINFVLRGNDNLHAIFRCSLRPVNKKTDFGTMPNDIGVEVLTPRP